jgi:AbiV family abortive infection protein
MTTKRETWIATVDNALRTNLITSANESYQNASDLLDDAKILFEGRRYSRANVMIILAEEEFSKAFILTICAQDRRWDSEIYRALKSHTHKQAIVETMLQYIEWFKEKNDFIFKYNQAALVPMTPNIYPEVQLFQDWITKAQKRTIKKSARDRYKQRLLYVSIDKNAKVSTKPVGTEDEAKSAFSMAKEFKTLTEIALRNVGVHL